MTIQVIVFDADGVVQHTHFDWRERLGSLIGGDVADAFADAIFAAEKPALTGEAEFRDTLGDILTRWRISQSIDDVLAIWNDISPDQAALALVDELRGRGLRVCLATNQQRQRGEYMDRTLGYRTRFNQSFYSYQVGSRKPDRAFFEHMLQSLGCAPDEILFIDDSAGNVAAAQAVGMRAARYDTSAEPVSGLRELVLRQSLQPDESLQRDESLQPDESLQRDESPQRVESLQPDESTAPLVLALRNLRKSYGAVKALDDIELRVREGQVYGFLGRNGAGKSTALRIVMGITHASRGEVGGGVSLRF